MNRELSLCNRQRIRAIDLRQLRRVVNRLLSELASSDFDLAIHLIADPEMTRLNETCLRHAGSTDVITFDYGEPAGPLAGELFVCVDEALRQALRFRVTWQEELIRYVIHGILHLRGHDDLRPAARRRMKQAEGRLLKKLASDFRLSKLARKPRVTA